MAKPWKDVLNSEQYQSLTDEQKAIAQQQYFDQVIAPQVPNDKIEVARNQFYEQFPLVTASPAQELPEGTTLDAFYEPTKAIFANLFGTAGAGLLGIYDGVTELDAVEGGKTAQGVMNEVSERFAPQTQAGQDGLEKVSKAFKFLSDIALYQPAMMASAVEFIRTGDEQQAEKLATDILESPGQAIGGRTFDATQSPAAAAFAETLPSALMEIAGLGMLNRSRRLSTAEKQAAAEKLQRDRINAESELNQAQIAEFEPDFTPEQIDDIAAEQTASARSSSDFQNVKDALLNASDEEVAALIDADPRIIKAVDDLNINTELPAIVSTQNDQVVGLLGALRAVPGSALEPQFIEFVRATQNRADNIIEQYGGSVDKAAYSQEFKTTAQRTVSDMFTQANELYNQLREAIPLNTPVNPSASIQLLDDVIDEFGGVGNIPEVYKGLKKLRTTEKDGNVTRPTYAVIDQLRREVGQAIRKGTGPFREGETATLKRIYAALRSDQDAVAIEAGYGDVSKAADALVSRRKQFEDDLQFLLGRDLNQALNIKVSSAVKALPKGQVDNFLSVIKAIPEDFRQGAVMTALNDVFKGTAVGAERLDATQFTKWYQTLSRSPKAKQALFAQLPTEGRRAIEALYEVSRGVSRAKQNTVRTGAINTIFNDQASFVSRLVRPLAQIATGGDQLGNAAVDQIMSLMRGGDDKVKLATELLAQPRFAQLARQVQKEGLTDAQKASETLRKIERDLMNTRAYKTWAKQVSQYSPDLLQNGFLAYMVANDTEQQADN